MSERLTLTELQYIIRDSLYLALPDMYWVIAEISELNENYAGHCYMELVEKSNGENVRARIRAIIWCKKYSFLKSFFETSTGEKLKPGLKILVKGKIEYHELYGLSLVICDIDPAFTLGEMALRKQMIIRRLEEEGVFMMNQELELPWSVQRVAVISSGHAAGYSDFLKHLDSNSARYVFYTKLFESPMQGADMEKGIINALDRIAENINLFDIVVIIRGGGSQTDLSWFDNYAIAYHVTQFPLPVITGIGHDKDVSVTDMVAHTSLKTPTAVAGFLVDHLAETESVIMETWNSILERTQLILEDNKTRLQSAAMRIMPLSGIMVARAKEKLAGKIMELISHGKKSLHEAGMNTATMRLRLNSGTNNLLRGRRESVNKYLSDIFTLSPAYLNRGKKIIESFERNLELIRPENVLKRGYSITFINDHLLKSAREVNPEDTIETMLIDGSVISRVIHKTLPIKADPGTSNQIKDL